MKFRDGALAAIIVAILAMTASGCSARANSRSARDYPSITPVSSASPVPASATSQVSSASPAPASTMSPSLTPPALRTPRPSNVSKPPVAGRWIDVDVSRFIVRLMDGTSVRQEIGPVAVGAAIDTGAYESTQTGIFYVYETDERLAYDAPYNTYINDWVGFDPDKANGFHSFLKDKEGAVVDASTGRVSNGCIRTDAPEAVFGFAEIGMPVYVHY